MARGVTLKLWLLRPSAESPYWDVDYKNVLLGVVVRADTEERARAIVQRQRAGIMAGGGQTFFHSPEVQAGLEAYPPVRVWEDPEHSTCWPLTGKGAEEIVIEDFRS